MNGKTTCVTGCPPSLPSSQPSPFRPPAPQTPPHYHQLQQAPNYAEIDEDDDEYEAAHGGRHGGRGGYGGGRLGGRGSLGGALPRGSGTGLDEYGAGGEGGMGSGGGSGGGGAYEVGGMMGSGGNFGGNGMEEVAEDTKLYCVCRKTQTGGMVACDNEKCKSPDEWYHYECMNLPETMADGDKWHCPGCTKRPGGQRWAGGSLFPPGLGASSSATSSSSAANPPPAPTASTETLHAQRSQGLQAQHLLVQQRAQQAAEALSNAGIAVPKASHKSSRKKGPPA